MTNIPYIIFTVTLIGSAACLVYNHFVAPRLWMRKHANGNEGTLTAAYARAAGAKDGQLYTKYLTNPKANVKL
jgi:hypothetical protein